jgi:prepilin-type N-terminal cleavage/methylation domain-containing protein
MTAMNKHHRYTITAAFTLIELLVVVAIIALLAGIAGPGLNMALKTARISRATADARQVGLALRGYAQDNDGAYPEGKDITNSNQAFRELFPTYMQVESNFAVASSPVGKSADNKIEPETRALERGENHWAYVAGLNDTSHALWPLIVDHTDGSGYYGKDEKKLGGTWGGSKAVVVRCDGGAIAMKLEGTGSKRFIPRHDDSRKNALQVRDYMGDSTRLLEPMR